MHAPTFLSDRDEFTCCNVQLTHQLALASKSAPAVHVVELRDVGHFDFTEIGAIGVAPWLLRMAAIQQVSRLEGTRPTTTPPLTPSHPMGPLR